VPIIGVQFYKIVDLGIGESVYRKGDGPVGRRGQQVFPRRHDTGSKVGAVADEEGDFGVTVNDVEKCMHGWGKGRGK